MAAGEPLIGLGVSGGIGAYKAVEAAARYLRPASTGPSSQGCA